MIKARKEQSIVDAEKAYEIKSKQPKPVKVKRAQIIEHHDSQRQVMRQKQQEEIARVKAERIALESRL